MGIFTGIGGITPDATRYKKLVRGLENRRADMMVTSAQNAIDFRTKEDPREQAQLNQSMWGRGLGKSTIADQDKDRLTMIQGQRNQHLAQQLDYAQQYKRMIKRKHRWQKVSQYYEAIDGILGVASGASNTNYGAGVEGSGGGGGDYGFGGGGEGGDFSYGGTYG